MNFFKDNKNIIIISLITVVFVSLMISSTVGKPNAGIVSNTIGVVLRPFQSVGTYITNCLRYGADADKFATENALLKQQLIVMTQKAADYDKLSAENEKLRSMLELAKSSTQYNLKAASVIGSDTEIWTSVIRLDKGLSDGIKKNDAVITETGLVGYVSEVGRTWSTVVTVIDASSSVGAIVDRIGEYCMVQGDVTLFDQGFCSINYLTTESSVSVGDIVTTSGVGGVYPEGIVVGKINEINSSPNGLSRDAVVEPSVNFSELDEVFVIVK